MNQKMMKFAFIALALLSTSTYANQDAGLDLLSNLKCSPNPKILCSGQFKIHEFDSTEIGLLNSGEESLMARLQTLKLAKKSIRIQALVIKADESGRRIADILLQKKREGLDIKIIVDAFSNLDLATQLMYYDLKMAGIEVEGYEAVYLQWVNEISIRDLKQPNKRFHDKMWIIDGEDLNNRDNRVAIIGGMNVANEYFRVGATADKKWRDQDFIVKGEMINDIVQAFDRNYQDQKDIKATHLINTDFTWKFWRKFISAKLSLQVPKKPAPSTLKKIEELEKASERFQPELKNLRARFIQNRPRYKETYIEESYQKLFSNAKNEILVINAYFIPSKATIDSLKSAAKNGADVKIITNSPETNDLPQMAFASRFLYKDLLSINKDPSTKGKLEIFEWAGNNFGEGTIHAKFAVIDEETVIGGSYNLDPRSENLNSETVVVFEEKDMALKLSNIIKEQDLKKVRQITFEDAIKYHNPKNPPDFFQLQLWNGLKGML